MAADSRIRGRAAGLTDRRSEREMLDRLLGSVRAGESRALVVRGDPGVGKTALLDYLVDQAQGCRVAHTAGVQSEMELAFAGLHQLCAPILGHAERLPGPQHDALLTAFGMSAGPPPDRFLVGLAVLGLLSEVAAEQPLICVVDDEQWLDHASAQALGFVARRLAVDRVGLVLAARAPGDELAGLPELEVEGLREDDARELLDVALPGPMDARVRDLIIAEARGNPLALLELPRGLTPMELAGGFGLPAATALSGRIEDGCDASWRTLPAEARRLLQLAAADPSGDPVLVRRAAGRLGLPVQAAAPAVEAGLVEFGVQVRFRHPLVRSAAYRSGSVQDRHAGARRAGGGHRSRGRSRSAGVAPGAERGRAGRGRRRRAGALGRPGAGPRRAGRGRGVPRACGPADGRTGTACGTRAGRGPVQPQAGAFDKALELLATAEAGPLDELQQRSGGPAARGDRLRLGSRQRRAPVAVQGGQAAGVSRPRSRARDLPQRVDGGPVRRTTGGSGDLLEVSRAARALPPSGDPLRPVDLVLDGLARS